MSMEQRSATHRRAFLQRAGIGLAAGGPGLYHSFVKAAELNSGNPLAPRKSHYAARAKQLLFIYLTGGFSHIDTFDPKPRLKTDEGKTVAGLYFRDTRLRPLMPSPFRFSHHGECGLPVSELFPHFGALADELCVLRSLYSDIVEHFQATLQMH